MAKRTKTPVNVIDPEKAGTLIKQQIEDIIHTSMLPYAEYVILERALPRVEDGLKPVQRRILYTMNELKMDPDKPYRKSARVVGDTLGKYHPHGDTSVYDAMVRMAQGFNMSEPLVDGHGNFGSIDGDTAAAMRYTEVRLSPIALEMLRDIDKETVPFRYNFDDTLKEPEVLPSRFPNLLVNGASGIAVGFATEIPPHNLAEVIDGVIMYLINPNVTTKELMACIPAPDFPTGAYILPESELEKVYDTGRGKIVMRAKSHVENISATKNAIVITEMPYQVNKAKLLERIAKLCEERKGVLASITDIRDESDKTGIRAVIEIKKEADPDVILAYLYKYTDLQLNFNANMVAVAGGKPVRLSLRAAISYYVDFQKDVIRRKTQYELDRANAEKHIKEGLIKACDILDEVIATIRGSKNPSEARENLVVNFDFTREQAQAILDLKLQRLTNLEILTLKAEFEELCKKIAEYEALLGSDKVLIKKLKSDLMELRSKYARPRRSEILLENTVAEVTEEQFIVSEDIIVVMTHNQEIKSIEQAHFNRANGSYKDMDVGKGDYVEYVINTSTDYKLLLFTDKGNCYQVSPTVLPTKKWKERGVPFSSILSAFDRSEQVVGMMAAKNFDQGTLLMVTKKGMCKRCALSAFHSSRSKVLACELNEGDSLISVFSIPDDCDVAFFTKHGMGLHTSCQEISLLGRASKGVRAMKLKEGDSILSASILRKKDMIALVSDGNYGKIVEESQLPLQKRGGVGIIVFKFNKNHSNGEALLSATCHSTGQEELMLRKADDSKEYIPVDSLSILPSASAGKPLSDWQEPLLNCVLLRESTARAEKTE